jgi:hypothetical protein
VLLIVAGVMNLVIGWWLSSCVLGMVASTCTGIITLGMCPFGAVCYFLPWFIIPVAVVEIIAGIVIAAAPESIKPGIRILPGIFILPILVGDFISPVAALVAVGLSFTAEVTEWMEFEE